MIAKQLIACVFACLLFGISVDLRSGKIAINSSLYAQHNSPVTQFEDCDNSNSETPDGGFCTGRSGNGPSSPGANPTDPCFFAVSLPDPIVVCPGKQITLTPVITDNVGGLGSYTFIWSVRPQSLIRIVGPSRDPSVVIEATGVRDLNYLDLTITRTDCTPASGGSITRTFALTVDTNIPAPSLTIDLGTCGGFPSTIPHWQLQLNATPAGNYATTWSGTNATFLNTGNFHAQFSPDNAGPIQVSALVSYQCGTVLQTANYNTDQCGNEIFNRKSNPQNGTGLTSRKVLQGTALSIPAYPSEGSTIEIWTSMGQKVFTDRALAQYKLNTGQFAKGMYYVKIEGDEGTKSMLRLMIY